MMPKKRYEQFEIIEDPDAPATRKPKRKRRPVHIPWRWVVVSFLGGLLVIGLVVAIVMMVILPVRVETNVVTVVPTIMGEGELIRDIAWSGGWTAVAGTNSLRVYDDLVGRSLPRWMNDYGEGVGRVFNTIALSPDGSQVAGMSTFSSPDGQGRSEIAVWDARTGDLLREFEAHIGGNSGRLYGGGVDAIAFSPDGRQLVTSAGDRQMLVWDTQSGSELANLRTSARGTLAMAFQPDGLRLTLIAREDISTTSLQVWDMNNFAQVSETILSHGDQNRVLQAVLSQDAHFLALYMWGEANGFFTSIWDALSGEMLGTIPIEEANNVTELGLRSPDLLAIASHVSGYTDPENGQLVSPHTELRVVRWTFRAEREFGYEILSTKDDYLSQDVIRHLHFETDNTGATWLHYLSDANRDLQRWNIDTGETKTIRFW